MLQNNPILKALINNLWNTLWSGGIANPLTAIEQITYLLFMKRLDDMEIKLENDASFLKEKYVSKKYIPIPGPPTGVKRNFIIDKKKESAIVS